MKEQALFDKAQALILTLPETWSPQVEQHLKLVMEALIISLLSRYPEGHAVRRLARPALASLPKIRLPATGAETQERYQVLRTRLTEISATLYRSH